MGRANCFSVCVFAVNTLIISRETVGECTVCDWTIGKCTVGEWTVGEWTVSEWAVRECTVGEWTVGKWTVGDWIVSEWTYKSFSWVSLGGNAYCGTATLRTSTLSARLVSEVFFGRLPGPQIVVFPGYRSRRLSTVPCTEDKNKWKLSQIQYRTWLTFLCPNHINLQTTQLHPTTSNIIGSWGLITTSHVTWIRLMNIFPRQIF